MAKNYFTILGVTSDASSNEIRSAYRRLAKEFHPDHFEGGSGPFREIQEAYSVLGDTHRRRAYKRSLGGVPVRRPVSRTVSPKPEPLIPERGPVEMGDISLIRSFETFRPSFEEIFEWLWDDSTGGNYSKSGRVQHLTVEVPVTRGQAFRGGNTRIVVPFRVSCPICRGAGGIGHYECPQCSGSGVIVDEMPLSVTLPPGLRRDHAVCIPVRSGMRNFDLTVLFRLTDEY